MANQSDTYYTLPRNEIFELVNVAPRPKKIVEFGCGFGALGKTIKESWDCHLTGLELNPEAAKFLAPVYDEFRIVDLEEFNINDLSSSYDCFIYADVLEHLRQPDLILKQHLAKLENGGTVIISIPNIRNLKVIFDLLIKGEWTYSSSGILDKTHYKFFTKKTLLSMLNEAGLTVELIKSNRDEFTGIKKIAAFISYLFVPDLRVCQWIIRAKKQAGFETADISDGRIIPD